MFGIGGLGHLAVQYARIVGGIVVGVDVEDAKLDLATELGADHVVNARTTDPVAAIGDLGGIDVAVALAATPASFEQAFRSLRRGGRLVCVALPADGTLQIPIFDTVLGGISVIGSIVGTRQDLADVFALHSAGRTRVVAEGRIKAEGGRDAVARRWAANVAEVRAQPPVLPVDLVDAVDRLSGRFLAGREPLFTDRGTQSRIIDGHGDLITDDVFCLDDGPRALDCLEFDDRLRYVDGLDDVAFLAMDLERLGRPDLAEAWLDAYVEFSADPAPSALRHHYVAYRAFVRAKVACLRTLQGDTDAAADAHRYAELARRHLESGAVRLALVGGLPGTGKTTVAGGLADRAGAVLLSSDRLRKELAGLDPDDDASAPYGEGIYSPARTDEVYGELLRRAGALLARGESVVLDASWTRRRHRRAAEELARHTHSDLVLLHCTAPSEVARQRLVTRPRSASDATAAIATALAATADPWPEARVVLTTGSVAHSVDRATALWASFPGTLIGATAITGPGQPLP